MIIAGFMSGTSMDGLDCCIAQIDIDSNLFRDLKRKFSESGDDPYKVLGVEPSMPFDHIKKIYLKKRKEFHPDTLISKGLPDELIDRAREKFIEIQEAFKEIEKREK